MYAVIRIRGSVNVRKEINDTLDMLKLKSVNNCVVLPETSVYLGMIRKAKDYITLTNLLEKRSNVKEEDIEKEKPVFRLNPPRGGFKSIRLPYPKGDLGNRKEEINKLLERMI